MQDVPIPSDILSASFEYHVVPIERFLHTSLILGT